MEITFYYDVLQTLGIQHNMPSEFNEKQYYVSIFQINFHCQWRS